MDWMVIRMVQYASIFLLGLSMWYGWNQYQWTIINNMRRMVQVHAPLPVFTWDIIPIPDRDSSKLELDLQIILEEFLVKTKEAGYHVLVTEWLRSQERHAALYAQWRTKPGNKVTWIEHSKHQDWLAFDIAFDPKVHGSTYPENTALRESVGEIWEDLWLIRWGRWRRPDRPHFQLGW